MLEIILGFKVAKVSVHVLECDMPLGDGTRKIFLNTKGTNEEEVLQELVHFLKYMENSSDKTVEKNHDESIQQLHDRVLKLKRFLQRCRWDFVIRSFKAVKSNHDRELTMERFQKRRYVPLSNLTDSKKWVCSGQQSNSFKNTQNIKSIVKIHKYSKIHRKEQDRSLSKTKHNQVLFWTIR